MTVNIQKTTELYTVVVKLHGTMEFSRQKYWNRLPFPSPGDLPDPGIEPWSPTLQADALPSEPPVKTLLCTKTIIIDKDKQPGVWS